MENSLLIVNALFQTDENLSRAIDGRNSWWTSISRRGARVRLYRDYERGDHRADMTEQMRKMLRLRSDVAGLNDFNDNYMRIVIDMMAGRVAVSEISTDDETADKNWLEPLLAKQDFMAAEGMWWRGAIRDGDAFVMVDPVSLLWSSEPAYDGFSGMVAIYNQMTRKPVWACKMWSESDELDAMTEGAPIDDLSSGLRKVMRLIVYQPDRISYWWGFDGGTIIAPMVPDDGIEITPTPDAAPMGKNERPWPAELEGKLPFVSFANQRDNYTRYGESEIRPAIPLQDVLNRTMYSMVMASEFAAFPVNWSKGMAINPGGIVPGGIINLTLNDAAGKPITEFTTEQIAFLSASAVGQFSAADISQYTNQIAVIVKEISNATQTNIYGLEGIGRNMSGEALKQLEIGLISKCMRFQRQNTDALKELIMLTANMERVFAPGMGSPALEKVSITWKSPELIDEGAAIAALVDMRSKATGLWADKFYQQKIGQLLGMSKGDIVEEIKAAEEEKAASIASMAAFQPTSMFGQGTNNTAPTKGVGDPGVKPNQTPAKGNGKPADNAMMPDQQELPM